MGRIMGILQARILQASGLPFPSLRDLPDLGIEPTSPALVSGLSDAEPPENWLTVIYTITIYQLD